MSSLKKIKSNVPGLSLSKIGIPMSEVIHEDEDEALGTDRFPKKSDSNDI